ncbi:DUF4124 domain-containing protein [Rugamonas apoptosis]|uniref:DUF4124 domain-containing protein n=1 Tax=Rugamonas apoptosis TaxID=2758570 RepID=A0A7W2FCM3_9BURK|nr:DUF4124 domain-containing protein [Rugamonas apoptosis]MBA5689210.1 DUF4124 domain-containing protein [Rugamonas apoptosis]
MKTFLPFVLALIVLPGQAQVYKWTDANGHVQYSDHPQDGADAKLLSVARAEAAPAASNDDWRERERVSRQNRARQADIERRAAARQEAAKAEQAPFNPSANRSNKPMTDEEVCRRDRQQIEFAEQTKHLAISHGSGAPVLLTEAQRQEVIRERKGNHALTCGGGR